MFTSEMFTSIWSTIVVLGVLIFVHELGHFLVAKWSGVTVLRFSLGFGPKVFGFTRGLTEYRLSAIPLGGYVKMLGEDPGEELNEIDRASSFSAQPVRKRIGIVLAGPLSNLGLAIVMYTAIYAVAGMPILTTEIGGVNAGSPAEAAGLKAGDLVLSINGRVMEQWEDLSQTIQEFGEKPLQIRIRRGSEELALEITPARGEVKNLFGEPIGRLVIGIVPSGKQDIRSINPFQAGYYSLVQTYTLGKYFFLTIVKLFEGVISLRETLGGPILIAQMAGKQAQEGLVYLISFTAFISVNLAVLNLLPIPVLDGGHVVFFLLEAMRGRPIGTRKIEFAQKVGMVLLLLLMVFVFYFDIMRVLPGSGPVSAP